MNLASRLGEDLASGAEILLTPAAYQALPPGEYVVEQVRYDDRGEEIACHRFVGRRGGGEEKAS
jgi:hypothetical protein